MKNITLDLSGSVTFVVTDGTNKYRITTSKAHVERVVEPASTWPWDKDIRAELARNDKCPGSLSNGWWKRKLSQIDGLTFHHTLSDSPHATARHYIHKGGGRPSIPYTIWVTQTGEVLLCLDLAEGCWHDHTGHKNTHLSIGLAGSLHKLRPPDVQLDAAAKVAIWAIQSNLFSIDKALGHMDYVQTVCPGWASKLSGHWKPLLYNRIRL